MDPSLTPDEAEHLLRGHGPDREELQAVRDFIAMASSTASAVPSEATAQRHRAAMAGAVGLGPEPASFPRSRSNVMVRNVLRSKIFRTFAGALAGVVAMGGLAAAHTLPAPAQDAVSAVAERIGIDLPRSNEKEKKAKTGLDHDGDGVPDDNGRHSGTTGEKRGKDHDGDGTADDNGLHMGQTKDKRGKDHDGDGVADDNGLRKGDAKPDDDDASEGVDDDEGDDDSEGDDDTQGDDDGPKAERSGNASERSKDARGEDDSTNDD